MKYLNNILPILASIVTLIAYLGSTYLAYASGQVQILTQQSLFDQNDLYHVLGEVQNVGDAPVSSVKITATGYDDVGDTVATSSTYADLDILLPGDNLPSTSFWPTSPISYFKYTTTAQASTIPLQA